MTKVYAALQWATSTIAVTALVLSLLAAPAQNAWADDGSGGGDIVTPCDAGCDASYPLCTGACSTTGNCVNYSCKTAGGGSYMVCECGFKFP